MSAVHVKLLKVSVPGSKLTTYLLHTNYRTKEFHILKINSETGDLDLYHKSSDLTDQGLIEQKWKNEGLVEEVAHGGAFIGYCIIAQYAYVLLATQVKPTLELPGNHIVYTIQQSEWKKVSIQAPSPAPSPQQDELISKHQRMIQSFPLSSTHFYCETLDITRPFPNEYPPSQPCWEFVWNRWLTAPLRAIDLDTLCPPLLQGLASLKIMQDLQGKNFSIAMVSRRSRLHAGTRYNARGLNKRACPGNELEVETIIFRNLNEDNKKPEQPHRMRSEYQSNYDWDVQWSSHIHRRGTVPIWWSVQLKNAGVGEAEIKINHTKGEIGKLDTKRYYRRLQKRYAVYSSLSEFDPMQAEDFSDDESFDDKDSTYRIKSYGSDFAQSGDLNQSEMSSNVNASKNNLVNQGGYQQGQDADPSKKVSIINVNLLRKNAFDKQEQKLSFAYAERVQWLRSEQNMKINICNFDWHDLVGQVQLPQAVDYLWLLLANEIKGQGISRGFISRYRDDVDTESTSYKWQTLQYGRDLRVQFLEHQQGILRFNCADSLDRTNLAAYYTCLQIIVEQCRSIGLYTSYSQPNKEYLRDCPALTLILNEDDAQNQQQSQLQQIKQQNQQQSALMSQLRKGMQRVFGGNKPRVRSTPGMTQTVYQPSSINSPGQTNLPQIKSDYLASNNQNDYKADPSTKLPIEDSKGSQLVPPPNVKQASYAQQMNPGMQQVSQDGSAGMQDYNSQDDDLPEGWERRWMAEKQCYIYLDHKNKKTTWTRPTARPSQTSEECLTQDDPMPSSNEIPHSTDTKPIQQDLPSQQDPSQQQEPLTQQEPSPEQEPSTSQDPPTQEGEAEMGQKQIFETNELEENQSRAELGQGYSQGDNETTSVYNYGEPSEEILQEGEDEGRRPEQTSTLVKDSYLVDENGQTSMIAQQKIPLVLDKTIQQNITDPQQLEFNDKPWGLIQALLEPNHQKPKYNNVQAFALQVQPQLLSRVAELFVMNGNVNAAVYTGSDAMHLDKILLFESEGSPLRLKFSAQNNAYIAIIRRYNNLWSDQDKQEVTHLFLGENLSKRPWIRYNQEDDQLLEFPDSDDEEYNELQRQVDEANAELARKLKFSNDQQQHQQQQQQQQQPSQLSQTGGDQQYQSPQVKQYQYKQQQQQQSQSALQSKHQFQSQ